MREIKFRAKRVDKDKFAYGDHLTGMGYKKGKHYLLPLLSYYPSDCHSFDGYEVIPDTIGQYTGLKDQNGKEIYDGDILLIKEYKNDALYYEFNYEEIKELSLEDVRGELQHSYKALIYYEEGCFVVSPININRCETYISEMFGDMKCSQPIYEYEVIGNIYDNPELIKELEKPILNKI